MRRNRLPVLVACAFLQACGGRQEALPEKQAADETAAVTIATVNGDPIGADAVRAAIVRRGGDFVDRYAELGEKEKVVEDLVRVKVLAQAARQQGYDRDPEIQASLDQLLADRYWRERIAVRDATDVTDTEVERYYTEHAADFTEPERVRGAVVYLAFPADAPAATKDGIRRQAAALRRQATELPPAERTFGTLARRSDDPTTRARGGDLGFIARDATVYSVEAPVRDALFALRQPGALSPPVETTRGVYLVKLVERAGGRPVPLASVASTIRRRLHDQRVREAEGKRYAAIRKAADVRVDRERLRTVGPARVASTSKPPSFPVGEAQP